MATVLVIGASRGIGFELARQYADDGARVIATHRKADDAGRLRALGARPLALDLLDVAAIGGLGAQLEGEAVDIAIVNAGVYGPRTTQLTAPSQAEFDTVMRTNVHAPMQLAALLGPRLAATRGKLAVISSAMGSISRMSHASGWLYRASKAALNSVLRSASLELGPQGVVCMAFHPGWVRTDMGGPDADLDVKESVASIRHVIEASNASHNGKFLNYNGEQLGW